MAYTENEKIGGLETVASVANDDFLIIGDTSDLGRAKAIVKTDLITDLNSALTFVAVSDTAEIDLTLTGKTVSATIVAGSIDESKLDASVNASLDLADSAVQDLSDLGVTATASELNILDGVTASTAELNILDGVTATATELNYVDGVTSAIQTQLDGKQASDSDLTTIAGLTPSNDDFLQRKAGAWANRTVAQVKTDLGLTGTNSGDVTVLDTDDIDFGLSGQQITGSLKSTAISAKSTLTLDGTEEVLVNDGGILKKTTTQDIADLGGGGGGGGAPTGAEYITLSTNGSLTHERVLTAGTGISIADGGAGSTVTVASTITQYTDELAQDAVGGILVDSTEIDFTYNDGVPSITASIVAGSIDETKLDTSVNASLDLADSALQSSAIGVSVQGYSAVLAATTASFTTADETKLDGIETGADVTDTTNVTSAGALMDSELTSLSGVKTLTVPDNTTISTYGASLVNDTDAATARTTLGLVIGTDVLAVSAYDDATAAETNTGTSTAKYVSPDGLAGSYAGTKSVELHVIADTTALATGDGKMYFFVPTSMNGMDVVSVNGYVVTAGTTNSTTIQLHNVTDGVDILSTPVTITTGTTSGGSTVNTSNDSLATGDRLRVDIDSVSTTPPSGLYIIIEARLP